MGLKHIPESVMAKLNAGAGIQICSPLCFSTGARAALAFN